MTLYISKDNQQLLWNFIHTNKFVHKKLDCLENSEKIHWFRNVIGTFYEKNKHVQLDVGNLNKLNKETVEYMIQNLNSLSIPKPANELTPRYIEKEVKQNQYINDYQQRQQEYNEMIEKKIPEEVNFKENYEKDEALTNMDELIKKQIEERELDLKINKPQEIFQENPILKIDNSSNITIEHDILENNQNTGVKKSVSWSDNLEEYEKKDYNKRFEILQEKCDKMFKDLEKVCKENRELFQKVDIISKKDKYSKRYSF